MQKVFFENIESILSTTIAFAENRIYIAVAWLTNVVFYNGWEPNTRGERIMKEFFVKAF